MDFFEAMAQMRTGAKVRLKSWPEDFYIGIKEEEHKIFGKTQTKFTIVNNDECELNALVSFPTVVKCQWELAKED